MDKEGQNEGGVGKKEKKRRKRACEREFSKERARYSGERRGQSGEGPNRQKER